MKEVHAGCGETVIQKMYLFQMNEHEAEGEPMPYCPFCKHWLEDDEVITEVEFNEQKKQDEQAERWEEGLK